MQYIGARYVPKFMGTHDITQSYENMCVVDNGMGTSYISQKPVPAGTPLTDTTYWALYGASSGAIVNLQNQIDDIVGKFNYVTPQEYGALGDGLADDTQALQDCFDDALVKKLGVFIPSGTYNFTSLTIQTATFGDELYITTIIGSDRNSAKLVHTGSGVAIDVVPTDISSYINGFVFKNINLVGNANTTIGINLGKGTRMMLDNLSVQNATDAGIKNVNNMWLCTLTNIYVGDCVNGIWIYGGTITSIFYDEIYVMRSTNIAYKLSGIYSNIGTLCADQCTGNSVYYFDHFNGNANVLGSEACDVRRAAAFLSSTVHASSLYCWNLQTNTLECGMYVNDSAAMVDIITFDCAASTDVNLPICDGYMARIEMNTIKGNMHFDRATSSGLGLIIVNGLKHRSTTGNRAFLGSDRSSGSPIYAKPYLPANDGVAIFTNCKGSPAYDSDGNFYQYSTPVKNGDWFIENDPGTYNVAGYVILADNSSDITSAVKAYIPITLSGPSTDRPATIPTGSCYFDTTLGKPIWRNGASWVDATGATV